MPESWTIRRLLEWTTRDFEGRGLSTPRLEAELLLAHGLDSSRLSLFLDLDRPVNGRERAIFRALVERRREREPLAYITGTREFWSLPFEVNSHVLVPRPETEILVEEALVALDREAPSLVADVGTGSGCIAAAIATERPGARIVATDVDAGALSTAARNVARLDLGDRIRFLRCDLLSALGGGFDLVVSNPPYISAPDLEGLEPEVARYEPRHALDGGADGLGVYRRLLPSAGRLLRPGGTLLLEVGDDEQGERVQALVQPPLRFDRCRKDYGDTNRVVIAVRQ